ncbi:MAG: hypothetical protein K0R18_395 [Bacillales bacterium]|jgi:hypothetical protein|nr:hypothetical protein [Bacillales bacterium]
MLNTEKLTELKLMMKERPAKRIRLTEKLGRPYQFKGQPFPAAYRGKNFISFLDMKRLSKLVHQVYIRRTA